MKAAAVRSPSGLLELIIATPVKSLDGYPDVKLSPEWCRCGANAPGDMIDDDCCVCGIAKHHVHCRSCGHLVQWG